MSEIDYTPSGVSSRLREVARLSDLRRENRLAVKVDMSPPAVASSDGDATPRLPEADANRRSQRPRQIAELRASLGGVHPEWTDPGSGVDLRCTDALAPRRLFVSVIEA